MPGTTAIGDLGLAQRLDFLAAATEHEGVAALEAHRTLPGAGGFDQQSVDRVLADAGLADAAADGNARGIAAGAIENLGRDQLIVKNHIGILQRAQRLDRQQVRIARSGPDQRHLALGLALLIRAGKRTGIGNPLQRLSGFVRAPGHHQRADRSVDDALPEPPAQSESRESAHESICGSRQ